MYYNRGVWPKKFVEDWSGVIELEIPICTIIKFITSKK